MRRWSIRNFSGFAAVLSAALWVFPELTAVRAQNAAPPRNGAGGIFVPRPREAGATLDEMAVLGPGSAMVATRTGDRITGSITGITKEGILRLTSPCFDREIGLFTSAISEVRFPPSASETGKDEVTLTNGDRLCGDVTGITANDIALESSALGLVKIGNHFVRQITFQTAPLARTDFSTGQPDPLLVSGGWQVSNGVLRHRRGQPATAALVLDQKGPITVVVDFAMAGRQSSLALFSDNPDHADRGKSLILNNAPNSHSISVSNGSNAQAVASNLSGGTPQAQVDRFAYDPASSEVKLWVDDKLVGETKAPTAPKEGKFIILSVADTCAVNHMEVFSGIIAPAKVAAEPDDKNDVVVLVNQDHYRAEKIVLMDGKFAIKTPFGAVEVPEEKVAALSMSKAAQQTVAAPEHAVQVLLPNTSLTVELVEMTDKTVLARSPYLGDVQIDRRAIRMLHFVAQKEGEHEAGSDVD